MQNMQVLKRDGRKEDVAFEKVQERITKSSAGLNVNPVKVAQKVLASIIDGISTTELDAMTAHVAYSWSTLHPDYGTLASRIAISNHQKNTPTTMLEAVNVLAAVKDRKGDPASLLHPDFVAVVTANAAEIEAHMQYERDFLLDYFGFKTMEKAYLLRDTNRNVVERPQHLWMRVALGLYLHDLPKAFETYELTSRKFYTHATPTLFNAGTKRPQLSSCFLSVIKADSIKGIFATLQDCADISQGGGGIGLSLSNVRAQGSLIKGTGGVSNGLVPLMRVYNNTARYVDQCFTEDTLIHTAEGLKRIVDVGPGDMVLTSGSAEEVEVDGKHAVGALTPRFCAVRRRVVHEYSGPLLRVCVRHRGLVSINSVTPKHPALSVKAGPTSVLHADKRVELGLVKPDYHAMEDLKIGDSIVTVLTEKDGILLPSYGLITDIFESNFTGNLYDLEVDDVHDYLVDGFGIAHNGGGKRNGSFAMYLEPWHADVEQFLDMKKNTGAEEERARDLFYALWVPDLFMERVDAGGDWTLFCPNEAPGLADVVGADFKALYERYEKEGRGRKVVKAQKLWFQILDSQIETGTPYLLYKDAANLKSNQQNLGTIKSSNLCTEIIEYSAPDEIAVCNLASMSLPAFVKDGAFDFVEFRKVVKIAVRNLNRVIDINYYPVPEAEKSNKRHRPVGLGIQGLADVFAMLGMAWESAEAVLLNKRIAAHMYYAAVESSCDLASVEGTYETYAGSPMSKGAFQFDLWKTKPLVEDGLDWDTLGYYVSRIGIRNSLLIAPMPTASTSQILGNCECMEPYATHIFTRRTLAGEFIVVNKHLVNALLARGVWSPAIKDLIIANNGSVQGIAEIPKDVQALFKTVWEIKQKVLIDMAADRGPYVCQSQSLNLFMADPDYRKLTSMHFYAWRKGLKTGIYYLRTKAAASAQKFTVEPATLTNTVTTKPVAEDKECLMCSS